MNLRTLDQLEVANKRVLLRADLNVPISNEGVIADDFRIQSSLPTIKELIEAGAKQVIVCSHLGRPKGQVVESLSLQPVADRLSELLQEPVPLTGLPPAVPAEARVTLLENVRFHPGETKGDESFAKDLAARADVFVSDAFGAVHRAHASVSGIANFLPSAAGRLLQREIEILSKLLEDPERPYVAIVGGAKVSDKLLVLERLVDVADTICVGGAMCFTFFLAQGMQIGKSLAEPDRTEDALRLLEKAGDRLKLPVDIVAAASMSLEADGQIVPAGAIPGNFGGYDIGPETVRQYSDEISKAGTVMWNGPMGVFEMAPFAAGTAGVAKAVTESSGFSVIGGGDSMAAIQQLGLGDRIDHASTGGGAMLEFLEGKQLPGLEALRV